jgi:transketolase
MFAGHHRLDNLVLLIDNNDLQAGGHTKNILNVEPVPEKFEAFGFKARRINGNSVTSRPASKVALLELVDCLIDARARLSLIGLPENLEEVLIDIHGLPIWVDSIVHGDHDVHCLIDIREIAGSHGAEHCCA